MKPRWAVLLALILSEAVHVPAANREMIELQRDVAQLQQQITTLQTTFDQRLVNMQVILQQTLDATNKTNAAMANIEKTVGDQIRAQSKQVVAPVAAVGAKVDTMSGDMQALTEAVKDLTARMGKIQQQLVDVQTAVRTMAAPAPAPPPAISQGPAAAPTPSAITTAPTTASGVPPMRAEVLWQSSMRDMKSGKPDLALAEFQDYLKFYGTTDLAPSAQFNIGQIHYSQGNLPVAIQDFDAVIERYPVNSRTPDAYFMKGKSLVQSGHRDKGVQEFQALIDKFPRSDLAASAKGQLKALGLNPPARPVRRR
ncbi:MAG: tetratricopeptide repeat protein [Acidobacteriota bacterium]|nr:tetratricopeptide repeat protein [Acidobacteriota bacterium]